MKRFTGVVLALLACVVFFATPAQAGELISRSSIYLEFLDDVLTETTKFESEFELTLRGKSFTLYTRYGNDWPFPFQDKDPKMEKRYISFDLGDTEVTAGNFSYVIGQGIVLSAIEDKQVGRDSQLDGILWEHDGIENVSVDFFYGLRKTGTGNDYPVGANTVGDPDRVWGGVLGIDAGDVDVSGFYLSTYIANSQEALNDAFMGFDVSINTGGWRFMWEHDFRDTYMGFEDGHAEYVEVSGGWPTLAVTGQYKDYHAMFHPYGSPPRLRRGDLEEQSINPNDEQGYMTTLVYSPEFLNEGYITSIFAGSNDSGGHRPFEEMYIEYQHDLMLDTTFTLGYDYVRGTLIGYNNMTAQHRDYIFGLDHAVGDDAIHLSLRYLEIDGELGNEEESELGFDYAFHDGPTLSVFYETSSKEFELPAIGGEGEGVQAPTPSPGKWFAFMAFYDLDDNTTLEFLWGSKRGGYECSGGSCVNVPPFKGVQLIVKRDL